MIGNPGDGFLLAQKRLGPGRIHHAMRWLGQSQRAFDMLCERALTRYTHGSLLAEKQMIQDWIAESYAEMQAARLLTLQAAWKMDQLPAGRQQRRPGGDRHHQVLGRQGALQRDRPGDPGPRLARLHHRPAARVHVPGRPGRPHLRRSRRGAQGHRGPPDAEAVQGAPRCPPSTCPPAARPPRRSSPTTSTTPPSAPEPSGFAERSESPGVMPPQCGGVPSALGIVRAKRVGAEEAPHHEGQITRPG